jgi:hypothetical protein
MSKLIDQALEQIEADVKSGDFTAIEELLKFVPQDRLKAFLSEFPEEDLNA